MTFDLGLAAGAGLGVVALGSSLFTLLLLRRQRGLAAREIGEIRDRWTEDARKQEIAFADRVAEMQRDLRTLEMSMQNSSDLLRDGRLGRSGRANALNLLRSGVSPDTASTTLGIGRLEMRLLAKISDMLTVR